MRSVRSRIIVRMRAEMQIVPNDGPVDRTTAACMVCVDVGGNGRASGLKRVSFTERSIG